MIETSQLTFAYAGRPPILENIDLCIPSGSHVALMGGNGTGKSTLALLLKGLHSPTSGTATVDGFNAGDEHSRFEMMKRAGLVFQNPENTFVATTVERELTFGLENTGVPHEEMVVRVDDTLSRFDLERYRHTNPTNLSGGEKQRLALAAVMIMQPAHLILDEPTSLLDPWSRERILGLIREMSGTATIIHITQYREEALMADRVLVLDRTGISIDAPPEIALSDKKLFRSIGLYPLSPASIERRHRDMDSTPRTSANADNNAIELIAITHAYNHKTPFEKTALSDISLPVPAGSATVLLGPSGSGKTTLLEIAAGVTKPKSGTVKVATNLLRAMAFQFPEDQMCGETVESDVAFGPRNIGISESNIEAVVTHALNDVGLDPEVYRARDPLTLSGGEKRRAALAGVLAMNTRVLMLDEPTAGLDRHGMDIVLAFLKKYIAVGGTLIFSTHDFEVARHLADRAAVLDKGRIEALGPIETVFETSPWLAFLRKNITA